MMAISLPIAWIVFGEGMDFWVSDMGDLGYVSVIVEGTRPAAELNRNMPHDHDHDHPQATAEEKHEWALSRCRELGLRRTKALGEVLRVLIGASSPLSLAGLAESEGLRDSCDRATVYRLVTRLDEKGIIRRIGLHERSSYYVFLFPG